MTTRQEIELTFQVGQRSVTVKAYDAVGPEDCFDNLFRSVLHRYATGEDLTMPIPREVKDFMIRTNLFI
jgi:hypothetical protein